MIAPTNNTNFGLKTFRNYMTTQRFRQHASRLMRLPTLREFMGVLLLINLAAAGLRSDGSKSWQLVVQTDGWTTDNDLEIMTFVHDTNDGWSQENTGLSDGCAIDHFKFGHNVKLDKPNNRIRLEMEAPGTFDIYNNVNDRWIYYLDKDGPDFMEYLGEKNVIYGRSSRWFEENTTKRGQWRDGRPSKEDDSTIGYTVSLMKDDMMNLFTGTGSNFRDTLHPIRVHMNQNNTIKYFETSECTFEIEKITMFNEQEERIHLKLKTAYHNRNSYWDSNKPVDRWLSFNDTSKVFGSNDSKRFLFFLMEHYLPVFNASKKDNIFDNTTPAAVEAWLPSQKNEVRNYIYSHKSTYGLTTPALKERFRLISGITKCDNCKGRNSRSCQKCRGEKGVPIAHQDCPRKEGITCHLHCNVCNGTNMKIGDKVESHWRASGCGSKSSGSPDPATVAKVNDDGTLNIKWDDDCYQEDIPCDWVTKVSRDGCVACHGTGKYQKPAPEKEKPKCVKCERPLALDGTAQYCHHTGCGAAQPPPPRTECSNADCTVTFNRPDGRVPSFCENGHPTCTKLHWGKCVECDCGAPCKEHRDAERQCPGCSVCKKPWVQKCKCPSEPDKKPHRAEAKPHRPANKPLRPENKPRRHANKPHRRETTPRRRIAEDNEQSPLASFLKDRHAKRDVMREVSESLTCSQS